MKNGDTVKYIGPDNEYLETGDILTVVECDIMMKPLLATCVGECFDEANVPKIYLKEI